MYDHHRNIHGLGDVQQASHGLRLQKIGAGAGMAAHAALLAGSLLLLDESVDDACVLAVYAADAALLLQLLQRLIHQLVADHHGGIRHIHLEGGDALGVHVVDLAFDGVVPVVDGHVEAVVAGALAVCLLMPQPQAVVKRLALVGAGEVHHRGGAAPQRCPGAGGEIVRRGGIAHVQIEVGMGVDESGQQQHACGVHHLRIVHMDVTGHPLYLLAVHQHVRPPRALAGHHGAVLEQNSHLRALLFLL